MAVTVRENKTKAKVRSGSMALGAFITYHSPETVEMLGALGFDFVTFDMEHEVYSELSIAQSIRAAEAFGLTPVVRVPNNPDLILRLLDAGAQGVHVPRVNTKQDAEAVVEATKFHPWGKRTFYALGRAANYGLGITEEEYAEGANQQTFILLQVEEQEGIENLADILSVPHVDAIQIGPKDLWQSMGMPDRSVVWEILERALVQVEEAGRWGSMVAWLDSDVKQQMSRYKELGVRLVTVSARDLMVRGGQYFLGEASPAAFG